mgnify:CR=1 FL=1
MAGVIAYGLVMPIADRETVDFIRTAKYRKRFYLKVIDTPSGCHQWTGAVSSNGRGMVSARQMTYSAHRVAWMIQHGQPIPDKLTIDHLCYNGLCVNPDHLELVDFSENTRRRIEHFGRGGSIRVRPSRIVGREPGYQVLWTDYAVQPKKQRGRTFPSRESAEAFLAEVLSRPVK